MKPSAMSSRKAAKVSASVTDESAAPGHDWVAACQYLSLDGGDCGGNLFGKRALDSHHRSGQLNRLEKGDLSVRDELLLTHREAPNWLLLQGPMIYIIDAFPQGFRSKKVTCKKTNHFPGAYLKPI